jgi:hypothetical protein
VVKKINRKELICAYFTGLNITLGAIYHSIMENQFLSYYPEVASASFLREGDFFSKRLPREGAGDEGGWRK